MQIQSQVFPILTKGGICSLSATLSLYLKYSLSCDYDNDFSTLQTFLGPPTQNYSSALSSLMFTSLLNSILASNSLIPSSIIFGQNPRQCTRFPYHHLYPMSFHRILLLYKVPFVQFKSFTSSVSCINLSSQSSISPTVDFTSVASDLIFTAAS